MFPNVIIGTKIDILKILYNAIPHGNCKGLCQFDCGPIWMGITEYENIPINLRGKRYSFEHSMSEMRKAEQQFHSGQPITAERCQYLDCGGKCSIYEYRPLVCRTWGNADNEINKCPFGCKPGMTDDEYIEIMKLWLELLSADGSAEELGV